MKIPCGSGPLTEREVMCMQSQAGSTIPGEWQSVPLSISHATGSLSLPQKPMMGVAKPPPELPADGMLAAQCHLLDIGECVHSSSREIAYRPFNLPA